MVPASKTGAGTMSQALSSAHARGWNLATTLMVCITVFQAGNADFGVMANMTAIPAPRSTSSNPSNP